MKEFDKWNTKQPRELPSSEEMKHSSSLIDAVRKQGWVGALGMVKEMCEGLDDSFMLDCWCFNIVQNKIDEELDATS